MITVKMILIIITIARIVVWPQLFDLGQLFPMKLNMIIMMMMMMMDIMIIMLIIMVMVIMMAAGYGISLAM